MSRRLSRKIMEVYLGRKLTSNDIVHHIDGNPQNTSIGNLELTTLSEHSHRHMAGRSLSIETKEKLRQKSRNARPKAKLSINDVYIIRQMLSDGIQQWLIALAFGVNRRTVNAINTGTIWSWI